MQVMDVPANNPVPAMVPIEALPPPPPPPPLLPPPPPPSDGVVATQPPPETAVEQGQGGEAGGQRDEADGGESLAGNASEAADAPGGGEAGEAEGGGADDFGVDAFADAGDDEARDAADARDAAAREERAPEWEQGGDRQDGADAAGAAGGGGGRDEEVPLEEFLGLRGPVRHMVRSPRAAAPLSRPRHRSSRFLAPVRVARLQPDRYECGRCGGGFGRPG